MTLSKMPQHITGTATLRLYFCCLCLQSLSVPERLIQGVPVGVTPVLHINAKAVVTLVGQQVNMMVAQPMFSSCFTKTISVFGPATIKTDRAVTPVLKYSPASTWYTHVNTWVLHTPHIRDSVQSCVQTGGLFVFINIFHLKEKKQTNKY